MVVTYWSSTSYPSLQIKRKQYLFEGIRRLFHITLSKEMKNPFGTNHVLDQTAHYLAKKKKRGKKNCKDEQTSRSLHEIVKESIRRTGKKK